MIFTRTLSRLRDFGFLEQPRKTSVFLLPIFVLFCLFQETVCDDFSEGSSDVNCTKVSVIELRNLGLCAPGFNANGAWQCIRGKNSSNNLQISEQKILIRVECEKNKLQGEEKQGTKMEDFFTSFWKYFLYGAAAGGGFVILLATILCQSKKKRTSKTSQNRSTVDSNDERTQNSSATTEMVCRDYTDVVLETDGMEQRRMVRENLQIQTHSVSQYDREADGRTRQPPVYSNPDKIITSSPSFEYNTKSGGRNCEARRQATATFPSGENQRGLAKQEYPIYVNCKAETNEYENCLVRTQRNHQGQYHVHETFA